MKKRALIVASQTGGLMGTERDAERLEAALSKRGFSVDRRIRENATRQGILDGYGALVKESEAGDVAVVFYAGHGGLVANPRWRPGLDGAPRYLQFIVPFDIDESTDSDFRGITSFELSALLAGLTAETRNVTVILDCCHAARMSRDAALVPRALPRPLSLDIDACVRRLEEAGFALHHAHAESNPNAVRLAGAGLTQSAFEYQNPAGEVVGLLTESFLVALDETGGLPVTWDALGKRVRERVLQIAREQRPEVEGPVGRILFELEEPPRTGVLNAEGDSLEGGRILGIRVGDEYSIMPMAATKAEAAGEVAHATVSRVGITSSRVTLEWRNGHSKVPPGSRAFPTRLMAPRRPVIVDVPAPGGDALIAKIGATPLLRVAEAHETEGALATVRLAGNELEIVVRGMLATTPAPLADGGVSQVAENLRRLAAAQMLRELEGAGGRDWSRHDVEVEWGVVLDGHLDPLGADATLAVGDALYVKLTNHAKRTLHASIFNVGLGQRIALLSAGDPSGVALRPNEPCVLGTDAAGIYRGCTMGWAQGVPDDEVRSEELVVIVTDRPQDLRALENDGYRQRSAWDPDQSQLQQLVAQVQRGGSRDAAPAGAEEGAFAVHHIPLQTSPKASPRTRASAFVIDERPPTSMIAFANRGTQAPPRRVAVRLTDLVVHDTRSVFRSAVRIDSLVCTRSAAGDKPYTVITARVPAVNDGDRLPLDNLLVFQGAVRDFLDICVWVSRDTKDSRTLAEMVDRDLDSAGFASAAGALFAATVVAPQAAAIIAATGAAATLAHLAYRLILQASGDSIGLYRTSLLAAERFGLGRHPAAGLLRAQEFSFGYRVDEDPWDCPPPPDREAPNTTAPSSVLARSGSFFGNTGIGVATA